MIERYVNEHVSLTFFDMSAKWCESVAILHHLHSINDTSFWTLRPFGLQTAIRRTNSTVRERSVPASLQITDTCAQLQLVFLHLVLFVYYCIIYCVILCFKRCPFLQSFMLLHASCCTQAETCAIRQTLYLGQYPSFVERCVSLEEPMISAPNCKNLHGQFYISCSVSLSVSLTQYLNLSGRKGCWLIGPRSNDVGHNTPLVIGCDRRACATMFNLQTGHHWGGHHWSFLLSFFYLYVRSLDISECQRTPGMQRMRINCLEDAPLPFTFPISLCRWCGAVLLIHSPVFSGLRLYRFDLHMQSLYWLYLLVLSISAAYIVVAADRSRSQSLSAWVKRLGQRTDIRQMFKEK